MTPEYGLSKMKFPTKLYASRLNKLVSVLLLLILVFGIALSFPAFASIEEGIAAYNAGDYDKAFEEFSSASNEGSFVGKHMLASLYYQGHGVGRDLKKAASLFKEAAAGNYAPSLANLALMYSSGDGMPADQKVAMKYVQRAANAGDLQSQFNLGQAYRKGAVLDQDYEKAALWYRKAAESGLPQAQNELGLLFAQGQGVPLNYVQAFAWIDMPASAGDPQAIKNRAQLLEILDTAQRAQAGKLAEEYAKKYKTE